MSTWSTSRRTRIAGSAVVAALLAGSAGCTDDRDPAGRAACLRATC
jgi:hypothetical protein